MDEITPTIIADAGDTMKVDPPAAERIKIESVGVVITIEVPVDNGKSISDTEIRSLSTDPTQIPSTITGSVIISDVVKGSVVVPTVETVVAIATPAVVSITQPESLASPHVTSISSTVSSVIASLSQTSILSAAASTSANRQTPHQELLQQNLSNAQDWDASDIEKKLADNAAMLSQWTLMLEKNGTQRRLIFRYLLISYLSPLLIVYN